ncbi:MAG: Ig-like domain-containing protein [Myxococcales bacterium]|nr:Ig-like domain-containing protein [Myxococcales bacterium]
MALAVLSSACTYIDEPGPQRTPGPGLALQSSTPSPGARDAERAAAIVLSFDRAVASESLSVETVRVFSGTIEVRGKRAIDLLARQVSFVPSEPLRSDLRYRVFLGADLRALDGSRLGENIVLEFTTGEALGSPPAPAPEITAEALQPLWSTRCVSCHGAKDPRAGLDLSSPDAVRRNLVNVGADGSFRQRVKPGDHAASYLMRKLIGPEGVSGMQMPPDPRDKLDAATLRRVADWIDSGAK